MGTTTTPALPPTGVRKAAILLLSLGDDASADVLRQLSEPELRKITLEVTQLGLVQHSEAELVLEEFCRNSATTAAQGGIQRAQRMLEQALGPEPARKVLVDVSRGVQEQQDCLLAMQEADPRQLANFLQNEHPQTIALILANMKLGPASAVLMAIPQEIRSAVVRRIGKLDEISPEVFNRLTKVMANNLKSIGRIQSRSSAGPRAGGPRAVADLLNQIEPTAGEEILRDIAQVDSVLGESIRDLMFVFEDVLQIDKEGIKALLGAVDRKALTIALKGTSDALKQHFLQCMSQRAAAMLNEDMEALGPVRLRDVDIARKDIVATIKKLQEEGTLNIKGGEADQFVE